jgi:hypothetical protein
VLLVTQELQINGCLWLLKFLAFNTYDIILNEVNNIKLHILKNWISGVLKKDNIFYKIIGRTVSRNFSRCLFNILYILRGTVLLITLIKYEQQDAEPQNKIFFKYIILKARKKFLKKFKE